MKPGRNGLPIAGQLNLYMVPAALLFTLRLWLEHPRGAILILLGACKDDLARERIRGLNAEA